MLISLTNPKQFEEVTEDVIKTISDNLRATFNKAVAIKIEEADGGGLKITLSEPYQDDVFTHQFYIPATIINGKGFVNKER